MQIHHSVKKVQKRNGEIVDFDPQKIFHAIRRAVIHVGSLDNDRLVFLTRQVVREIEKNYYNPTVEDVQDCVEKVLMNNGHVHIAKAYILYRQKRKELREERKNLLGGKTTNLKLPVNSLLLMRDRYLQRDNGNVSETPEQMFMRVAQHVARVDAQYGGDVEKAALSFYNLMTSLRFLPNSPCLMNAGTKHAQLFACYALPVHDSVESIFRAAKYQALIQQSGGGTGFNFSQIRPRADPVRGRPGVAAGPIQLLKVYDHVAESILQGGKRKGANMGILRVDHPDILRFITLKQDGVTLNNFNISVGLTEAFMDAVEKDEDYNLVSPVTGQPVQRMNARHVFDLLILNAWRTGDPGILFLDRMHYSRSNPIIGKKDICATSPCAEQPLYDYEGAVLGSINLSKCATPEGIDWALLEQTVHAAVHFLDNAIDANKYPLPQSEVICKQNRRIGLGVMGFADMLFKLKVQYDSEEAIELADTIMKFISENADEASRTLAKKRGPFPNFARSIYKDGHPIRNASRTSLSPTGSISLLAGCSASFDPVFSLSYKMRVMDKEILIVNPYFERALQKWRFYSEDLVKRVASTVSIQGFSDIPDEVKKIFKVVFDVSPQWQIRMQSTFQKHTDNAISKTVNFPSWATTRDVEKVFMLAYKNGCKGITIYRDQSKQDQVINVNLDAHKNNVENIPESQIRYCPECTAELQESDDIQTCENCGFSRCRV